ncbi:hypothetical protein [Bacillus clarus]|uniref:hypothetical protein n=2 Tax=Bacillus clarus TaxID=2338372 RepID=UPI000B302550|nr:hypothetical protein [Bacillus clarus]
MPLIGVGAIQMADDALKNLQYGIPLLSIVKELLIKPDWIKKLKKVKNINFHQTCSMMIKNA